WSLARPGSISALSWRLSCFRQPGGGILSSYLAEAAICLICGEDGNFDRILRDVAQLQHGCARVQFEPHALADLWAIAAARAAERTERVPVLNEVHPGIGR